MTDITTIEGVTRAIEASYHLKQAVVTGLFIILTVAAIVTGTAATTIASKFIEACTRQPELKSLFTECILLCALAEAFCAVGVGVGMFVLLNHPVDSEVEKVTETLTALLPQNDEDKSI